MILQMHKTKGKGIAIYGMRDLLFSYQRHEFQRGYKLSWHHADPNQLFKAENWIGLGAFDDWLERKQSVVLPHSADYPAPCVLHSKRLQKPKEAFLR